MGLTLSKKGHGTQNCGETHRQNVFPAQSGPSVHVVFGFFIISSTFFYSFNFPHFGPADTINNDGRESKPEELDGVI